MKMLTLTLVMGLMTTGCSIIGARYDPGEYAAFASLSHKAQLSVQHCTDERKIKLAASELMDSASYAVVYTKHQTSNGEMYLISNEILNLTGEFIKSTLRPMSPMYCKSKLSIINQAAETAMSATAAKRR